ncbi:unnamed protein product [Symbiodinium sp. CCMP2456]|nr:unnamed protein product [Symbiodinium sp. CCMP2456]
MRTLQDAVRRMLSSSGSVSLDPVTEAVVQTAKPLPMKDFQTHALFFWYDYFSCPQLRHPTRVSDETDNDETDNLHQANAINSIPAYVARCEVFIALCPVLDCPLERRVLTPATWSSHHREDVLARGRRASVVAGPPPEGASNFPDLVALELTFAEDSQELCCVMFCCDGLLPDNPCVGARDFHGTVVQYDELPAKLASVPKGPLVLLAADSEQADAEWGRLALPLDKQHCLKDAWQFAKHARGNHQLVQGLARVDTSCVRELFKASGQQGVFVEPVGRQDTTPTVSVVWHKPLRDEGLSALHERLLAERPAFGLLLGNRELGTRVAPQEGQAPTRTWTITGTPPPWTDDYIRSLLVSQTSLQNPAVVRRLVRKGACSWWVRASAGAGADAQQIVVETPEGERSYWVLPAPARPGTRDRGQPLRAGPFAFKREAFTTIDKPVLQSSEATEATGEEGRLAPGAKKAAAAAVRYRQIPADLERHVVPGDGSCLFHCLAKALPSAPTSDKARAETIAHMRKYATSFQKRWDGCDDRQQHLESFADYLTRMQARDAWAGALEILAAAKTYRCTILVLPERADLPPSAYNFAPSLPRVIVWHTGKHFDLLTLKANARLPDEIAAVTEEVGQASFPRVGGPSADDLERLDAASVGASRSDCHACASVASSAPTSVKQRARARTSAPLHAASVASSAPSSVQMPGLACVGSPAGPAFAVAAVAASAHGSVASSAPTSVKLRAKRARTASPVAARSIRSFFGGPTAAVVAGPAAVDDVSAPGPPAPGTPDDLLEDCLPVPAAAGDQQRYDSRGRLLKGRTIKAKDSWKCSWCDYVARGKHWCAYRHQHLKAWHPEHLQDFVRRPLQFVTPGPDDQVEWSCPLCDKALLKAPDRSADVLLQARLRHRAQCHPDAPKRRFLLPQARSGVQKASATRLADGVARRILMRRRGDFGSHDVRFFRIPWVGKPAKKPRSTRIIYACTRCAATATTPKRLLAQACERKLPTSSRTKFEASVRVMIANARHAAPLLDGCRQLLDCISPPGPARRRLTAKALPPPALRAHDVAAVAWPFLKDQRFELELRFLCLRCAACRKSRVSLDRRKLCDAVVRGGARVRRELVQATQDQDPVIARAAKHVLQLLDKVLPAEASRQAVPTEVVALGDAGTAALDLNACGAAGSNDHVLAVSVDAVPPCQGPGGLP